MKAQSQKLFFINTSFILMLFFMSTQFIYAEHHLHKTKKIYTVGFAQDTLANDWRKAQVNVLAEELKKHSNIKFIVTDAGGESSKQIQDIEDLAYQKVDVLITSPRNGVASTPAISRVFKQSIPVILVTRGITTEDFTTLISPDDYKIASDAANFMAKKLKRKGNILVVRGVPTATTAIARTKGFMDTMKKYPDIKITAIKDGNYLRGDAIRVTEKAIREKIPFDAVYAQSDSMASGVRIALRKAGIPVKEKIIVGIDYISEAREAIISGEQSASFLYPTCAKEVADVVFKILHGKAVAKRIIVKSKMVTINNVNEVSPIF